MPALTDLLRQPSSEPRDFFVEQMKEISAQDSPSLRQDLTPTQIAYIAAGLAEMILSHQRKDGGWSLRTFASSVAWGDGTRAEKLAAESDFENPSSDGHQIGLAIVVLVDAGVPADHPQIQRGIEWIKSHQRQSGRWWTRSLNTDEYHFITYSGTAYPLLALAKAGELRD